MALLPDTYWGKAGTFIWNKHQGEAETFISKAGGFYPVKIFYFFLFSFFFHPFYLSLDQMNNGLDSDVFFVWGMLVESLQVSGR